MASIATLLRDTVGQLVFKELAIERVRDVSPHFRRFTVAGDWLPQASWSAGDKLQIMISEAGPRTYTPFARQPASGSFDLLAFVHGDTAGGRWLKRAQAGQSLRAFGPRGSLAFSALKGPVVFVGDETSFAAAAVLAEARAGRDALEFVFESTSANEAATVLSDLGLNERAIVERLPRDQHLPALEAALSAALSDNSQATVVFTGHAQTIQALRARLKAKGLSNAGQKVKAYWADGKRGLD